MRRAGTRVRQRIEDDGGCRCHIQLRRRGFASPGPGTQDPRAACGDGERVVLGSSFFNTFILTSVTDMWSLDALFCRQTMRPPKSPFLCNFLA